MSIGPRSYAASLFRPEMGNEAVEGLLTPDEWALRFRSPEAEEEIPMGRLLVEAEAGGGRIWFKDPEQPDLRLFTSDLSILDHPSMKAGRAVRDRLVAKETRREVSRRTRLVLWFLGGCVAATFLCSWTMSFMVRKLLARVPPEWEAKLGEETLKEMREEGTLVENTNVVARLEAMSAPLMRVLPPGRRQVRFYLLDDDDPNAFAVPGGHVLVTTGLLRVAETPEELLGVVAHELAHVTEKHAAREIIASAGPMAVMNVFVRSRSGLLTLLGAGSGLVVMQGFSQEYETEADDVGWNYLVAANIDPRGSIRMFKKFRALDQGEGGLHLPQALQSHPALDKRISRLEAKWRRLPDKTGFLVFTNRVPAPPPKE